MAEKSFQKKKVRLYAAALSFLIVAFSFCPILRVSASSAGTLNNNINFQFLLGQRSGLISSNTDIYTYKVPIYMQATNNNPYFMTGSLTFTLPSFSFKFKNNDILYNYIESADNCSLSFYSGVYRLTMAGLYVQRNNYTSTLIGYFVFNLPSSIDEDSSFTCPSGLLTPENVTKQIYVADSQDNVKQNIIDSINSATDIQTIIDELYLIRNNSVLLADVVDELENVNGILGNIYNYMATMNSTQLNSMRQLVFALSGVDLSTTSASALSQATYNRWVQLIYDAINYQGPDSSAADQAADNLEDAHEANDVAQDSAYQAADTAMQNVNFNVTVPNGLTNAALTIGNYITSIYSQLGSDLQFLITATLTIGLITVILGVINRYPKNTYTTESETVSTGERNGKKFSSSYKTTTKRTRHR